VIVVPSLIRVVGAVFTLTVLVTRYHSVGSMTVAAMAAVIIVRCHCGNLTRILAGIER